MLLKQYLTDIVKPPENVIYDFVFPADYYCKNIEEKCPNYIGGISNYSLFIKRMVELLHLNFSKERVNRILAAIEKSMEKF